MAARKGADALPGEKEGSGTAAASSSSTILSFLARPLSLLRHVCAAGYLGVSRLRPCPATAPGAAAAGSKRDGHEAAAEEEVVVQVRSRALPQRPRGLREGRGGSGGAHH